MATRKQTTTNIVDQQVAPETVQAVTLAEAVANFKQRTLDELANQVNVMDANEVGKVLIQDLNKVKQEVLMRLMGIETKWGRVEIAPCNGRENPLNKTIQDHCAPLLRQWVKECLDEFLSNNKEKMKAEYKKAIIADAVNRMKLQYGERNRVLDGIIEEIKSEARQEALAEVRAELSRQMGAQ